MKEATCLLLPTAVQHERESTASECQWGPMPGLGTPGLPIHLQYAQAGPVEYTSGIVWDSPRGRSGPKRTKWSQEDEVVPRGRSGRGYEQTSETFVGAVDSTVAHTVRLSSASST